MAITPCAGWVSVGESMFIAFVIALICNIAVTYKAKKHMFDDALDVMPTHGLGGIVGSIFTGVFAYRYFFPDAATAEISHWQFFLNHVLGVVIVCAYTFVVSYALYWLTGKMVRLRVSAKSELIGLDMSQHSEVYGLDALGQHTELDEEVPTEQEWNTSIGEN